MNSAVLRKLHNVRLEQMDENAQRCDAYPPACFRMGGTLPGAACHQGLIPWREVPS